MPRTPAPIVLALLAAMASPAAPAAAPDAAALRLTLPPTCYAVVGQPTRIYFDNIVLAKRSEDYTFEVRSDLGQSDQRCWSAEPRPEDAGDHTWEVTVKGRDGRRLANAKCRLHVAPADAGAKRRLRLLIVGDSLTNATHYPNEIARLLSEPGNPEWKMIGTNRPASALPGVAHEGYGGWTWARFATHYAPPTDDVKKRGSPFVLPGPDGKPLLNVSAYLQANAPDGPPQIVTFLLGINDCFQAKADDPADVDRRITEMFRHADLLVAAFRKAAPRAELGICLTTPPNSRESGFEANYKGAHTRWNWRQVQHQIVRRQLEHYRGRQAERTHLVPTQLALDPVDGYPPDNGVHPNPAGYKQIAGAIYAWIKSRLEQGSP